MAKTSLEEQIQKAEENLEHLKKRKAEQDRKELHEKLLSAGKSLQLCGFGLGREELHIGCMLYAMEAMNSNPELKEQFQLAGAKFRKG